ncbi:glycosyltransferase [Candidatus Scalindua japonica]|uniref:Glycosyltransferase n=1 Tax=Candidatus Scalindua japonica TaxID=1284222 RepID=A0A286U183_9BACT|nr:glycosyltransferase [Candidatus Scalindua japonica]
MEYLSGADIEIYLVKPKPLSYKYSMPNKLFEAMAAGLSIVIDKGFVEMRKIVEKYKVGMQ